MIRKRTVWLRTSSVEARDFLINLDSVNKAVFIARQPSALVKTVLHFPLSNCELGPSDETTPNLQVRAFLFFFLLYGRRPSIFFSKSPAQKVTPGALKVGGFFLKLVLNKRRLILDFLTKNIFDHFFYYEHENVLFSSTCNFVQQSEINSLLNFKVDGTLCPTLDSILPVLLKKKMKDFFLIIV